jgi:ribosomal protein S18 acetylase RimI-like enzyme
MTTTIRQAEKADTTLLVSIIRTAFKDPATRLGLTRENSGKHASNITEAWVKDDMKRNVRYYVIEADGVPAGAVTVEHANADACYIGRLSVLPAYHRRGLGRELLTFAIGEAEKTGAKYASLGVISDETHLVGWYERMGFHVSRRMRFEHFPFEVTLLRREFKEK